MNRQSRFQRFFRSQPDPEYCRSHPLPIDPRHFQPLQPNLGYIWRGRGHPVAPPESLEYLNHFLRQMGYHVISEIGAGTTGVIYLAATRKFVAQRPLPPYRQNNDVHFVALKQIEPNAYFGVVEVRNEIDRMTRLRHPNLVAMFECFALPYPKAETWYLALEYGQFGSLAFYVNRVRQEIARLGALAGAIRGHRALYEGAQGISVPEFVTRILNPAEMSWFWAQNLLLGLHYLAAQAFVHSDLGPSNIFVFQSIRQWPRDVKIGDFGEGAWRTQPDPSGGPSSVLGPSLGLIGEISNFRDYPNNFAFWQLLEQDVGNDRPVSECLAAHFSMTAPLLDSNARGDDVHGGLSDILRQRNSNGIHLQWHALIINWFTKTILSVHISALIQKQ